MKPIEYINELKKQYVNTDINWELLLETGYRLFLDAASTVIDVGGHTGRHTNVFVNEIGCKRVLVFEPLPEHCERLRLRYADRPNAEFFNCALGARAGVADFVFNVNSPEESGLQERLYNDPSSKKLEVLKVEVASLDQMDLRLDRLDYVKIDTEGGEVDIILGAKATLGRYRPTLSVEYGAAGYGAYGKTRATLFELAGELDYQLFDVFGHALRTAGDWDECVDNFYWDFYMVPAERAQSFGELLCDEGIFESVPQRLARAPG